MQFHKHKIASSIATVLLISSPIAVYAEEQKPTDSSGSMEAIAETPFSTTDKYTGGTIVIYPSVLNVKRVADRNYSELLFYTAPLCVILTPKEFKTFPSPTPNATIYSFKMLNSHPDLESEAMRYVTAKMQDSTGGKFTATGANISRLTHQQVTFSLPDFPAIKIAPKGTMQKNIILSDTKEVLNMYVPNNDRSRFEEMIKADGLNLEVTINLIYKDVKISSISWSAEDIKKTEAYKELDTTGAHFVTARQLDNMVRETVRSKNAIIYRDPGVPEQLALEAKNMFEKFLDIPGETALFIKNQDEARKLEAEILAGTNLTAEQFKPITTMWEITEQLKDETDHKKANQKINESLRDKMEYSKFNTCVNTGADAGVNLVVVKLKFNGGGSICYDTSTTKHDVDKEVFTSQEEFNEFHSKIRSEHGMEVRITPRGLNLVETKKFKDHLSFTASSVAYYPVSKSMQLGITGAFVDKAIGDDVLLHKKLFDPSVAPVTAYMGGVIITNSCEGSSPQSMNVTVPGWYVINIIAESFKYDGNYSLIDVRVTENLSKALVCVGTANLSEDATVAGYMTPTATCVKHHHYLVLLKLENVFS